MTKTYDIAVVGAGVFGAWTAGHLAKRKQRVILLDAYGAANARASSAGESRIIRMGYGADEIYTRWSRHSLDLWKELFTATRQPLFHETGVLWLAGNDDKRLSETHATLTHVGVPFQEMDHAALVTAYPQVNFDGIKRGILEPHSGALMARRAVTAAVEDAVAHGAAFRIAKVATPTDQGKLSSITTSTGDNVSAATFVFACGSWLGKVFS